MPIDSLMFRFWGSATFDVGGLEEVGGFEVPLTTYLAL